MSADTIHLWHGIQRHIENARFSVSDIYRESDASVRVRLVSVATEERIHILRIGETFPVGDETWQLADLTGWPSEDDWDVVLRRVAAAPA
ncbi:DUF6406 domain-containing protein [Streptomyces chattanoogensis]|uniref:DUF6406 domain-containing protein n=1 Tax=Streptomyces chattanoogensis TaxID=66876 RepID=UPI00062CB27A|nr:hypothetical protein T261_6866 [Streptomyces lydicus]